MKLNPSHHHAKCFAGLAGALLGLGAPLGWLFWRALSSHPGWLGEELDQFGALYRYMTVGTVVVFAAFGYSLGRRSDEVVGESDTVKEELQKANELAFRDALTGVNNARSLHDQLSRELESARRYRAPVACVMIDIDGFKIINDTHGHPFGDAVLSKLAQIIGTCVRQVDIVGRLGGEEFLIIMPHTTLNLGFLVAERIRQAVQDASFAFDGITVPVTVSVGVACYPSKEVNDKSSLLKTVDDALYQAKRTGKNRTVAVGK